VLEWRLDPDCPYRNPIAADLERELILVCSDGYSSSLAAISVRELGHRRVADLSGGFRGWEAAGLPVRHTPLPDPPEAPGMGSPEPIDDPTERRTEWPLRSTSTSSF
jgi:3-mercaptopyruvate sulfurtransferase SseA